VETHYHSSEREIHHCCLGSDESQDQDQHGHETEEEDNEEKADEKANTSNSETRHYRFCQC